MSYRAPKDPRRPWEWCPNCKAWYELDPGYYSCPASMPDECIHEPHEHRLSEMEVNCASRPADMIAQAFGMLISGASQ